MKDNAPLVAIMGRPNVGKSTLLNRIADRMSAIVDPTPGVTRDRKYVPASWNDRSFMLADTGGVGIDADGWLSREVERQAFIAADEADVVVMVSDVQTGITADDEWLAKRLKKAGRETLLVVNKVDNPALEPEVSRFYAMGLGEPYPISAYHGLGIGDLLDAISNRLPHGEDAPLAEEIAVAIVGRPNVGKSSILNRLANEERVLVHEEPHTTRDTIDTVVEFEGMSYRMLDTAGMRKRRTALSDIEYYSSIRTLRAIDQADVVLLVIDAHEGVGDHDQRIARKVESRGKGMAILMNKWDLVAGDGPTEEAMESLAHKFRYARHLPVLKVSALTREGIEEIFPCVEEVYEQWNTRIPTAALNQFISRAKLEVPPPRKGNRRLKMYYATQVEVAPPTVVVFVNDAGLANENYRRFLRGRLREEYGFWGSPLILRFRTAHGKGRT